MEFAYNNQYHSSIQMAPYVALYGRKCRSLICQDEEEMRILEGSKIVQDKMDKVKLISSRLKPAQDRQKKNYADQHMREIEYKLGEKVFLRVSLQKGIIRFSKKGKLSPRYIGPYEILKRISPLAYKLALPPEMTQIHDVFHMSMLQKILI